MTVDGFVRIYSEYDVVVYPFCELRDEVCKEHLFWVRV